MTRPGFVLALALALIVATVVHVDARKGDAGGGGKAPKTMAAPSGKLTKQPLGSGKPKPSKTTTPIAQTLPKLPKTNNPKGVKCMRTFRVCEAKCSKKKPFESNKQYCSNGCYIDLDKCLPPSKG